LLRLERCGDRQSGEKYDDEPTHGVSLVRQERDEPGNWRRRQASGQPTPPGDVRDPNWRSRPTRC